jgi:hypothetical protein
MKIWTTCLFVVISISGSAQPVPETKNLHPEMHTIQFTLASVDDDFNQGTNFVLHGTGVSFDQIRTNFLDEIKKSTSVLNRLNRSNATYKEYAHAHIQLGDEFSTENKLVTGIVSMANNHDGSFSFKLNFGGKEISLDAFPLTVNEWAYFGIGEDDNLKHFMLIKLYEPTKQKLQPIVKTPVESGNEQGTTAEL